MSCSLRYIVEEVCCEQDLAIANMIDDGCPHTQRYIPDHWRGLLIKISDEGVETIRYNNTRFNESGVKSDRTFRFT